MSTEGDPQPLPEPELITRHKWAYRLGYELIHIVFLTVLFEVPDTIIWNWDGTVDEGNVWSVIFCVFAMHLTFYILQGSDPGYLGTHNCATATECDSGDVDPEMTTVDLSDESENQSSDVTGVQMIDLGGNAELDLRNSSSALNPSSETVMNFSDLAADTEDESMPMVTTMPPCEICGIQPPLRSHHCRFVNRCVAGYDHYCLVIGTCIGERNICRFWWFLFVHSGSIWYGIGLVHHAFSLQSNTGLWWRVNAMACIAAVLFWCGFCCSVPLFCVHSWLAATNTTGYECGKGASGIMYLRHTRDFDLPFSNGLIGNLRRFCWDRGVKATMAKSSTWAPENWQPPGRIVRNSEDVCSNIWENKYYSCC